MSDLRNAFRSLRSAPLVSTMAILSLALGIGANTAIFSILDSLMLRPLPVREPARLAVLRDSDGQTWLWTNRIWEEVRRRAQLFEGAAAWSDDRFNVARSGETEMVDGLWVSGAFFETLGVRPSVGRLLESGDDQRGGGRSGPVAVISNDFWMRHFAGSRDAIGRSIPVDGIPFTIVGVTPPRFFGPNVGGRFDVAIPIGCEPLLRGPDTMLEHPTYWWLNIMLRLRDGQTTENATAAIRGVQPQIRSASAPADIAYPFLQKAFSVDPAVTGTSQIRGRYVKPVTVIMVVVVLVLLIACANIANLLLARSSARRQEFGVRLALGASRSRLARQLFSESLVLAICGAVLGLVFAQWGSRLLLYELTTSGSSVFLDLSIHWRVLLFTAAATIATAVLFGSAPLWRAMRVNVNEALADGGRSVAGAGRGGTGNLLVAFQVAVSLVLVVAAGLFIRTFVGLNSLPMGFERDKVLVVTVDSSRSSVAPEQRLALFEGVREAAKSVPGVSAAALSVVTPISGRAWQFGVIVEGAPPRPEWEPGPSINYVSPGFFATYGTRLLTGRDFTAADSGGAPLVAIVNRSYARQSVGNEYAIGRVVRSAGPRGELGPAMTIVGVAEDAMYRSLRKGPPPTVYFPLAQLPRAVPASLSVSVRAATGSPGALARVVPSAIGTRDRNLSLSARPLTEQVNGAMAQERVVAMLSGFFAMLALLLAGVGLYGVSAYAVSRRRREIGIRMVLGARAESIGRLVLGRMLLLVVAGAVVGAIVSLWVTHLVATMLFRVEPGDPLTLVAAAGIIVGTAALGAGVPVRRATRIDPASVLHEG